MSKKQSYDKNKDIKIVHKLKIRAVRQGTTLLHVAAQTKDWFLLEFILDNNNLYKIGVNKICNCKLGCSPLITAINNNCPLNIIAKLIEKGANVNYARTDGTTALHVAAMNDYIAIALLLIAYKAHIHVYDVNGKSPEDYARSEAMRIGLATRRVCFCCNRRGTITGSTEEPQMFMCSGCECAHYCSRECQRQDREAHRDFCKALKKI